MLNNKVAVITGSTSGIGLAAAKALASVGADIMLHGLLSLQDGEALAAELADEYGVRVRFDGADMRDPAATKAMMERTVDELGRLDILVNNAGIQHTEIVDDFPEHKWHDIIAINLSAAFFTTQKALPVMKKNGWGRIINIASVHGLVGSVKKSAYCAAKHGIVGLTKVTALENAAQGVTVNAICPGWVNTPILQAQVDDMAAQKEVDKETARRQLVTSKQPLPEMLEPSQIGDMIVFLCSDSARSITGASLPIDGAWTAQ